MRGPSRRICNAQRYERSEARRDTRAGHYERRLQTKAGDAGIMARPQTAKANPKNEKV
jgi:hypothetical protein